MKTKTSSIVLLFTTAFLFAFICNIFTAHILLSSHDFRNGNTISPRPISSFQPSPLKLDNCIKANPNYPTINCPLGNNTPTAYHQAILSTFNNHVDIPLFHKCINLNLPLTPHDPIQCWPRLIILPSHATSGNELFQYLMDQIFTRLDISMSQYHEYPTRHDPMYSISNNPQDLTVNKNATASNYIFTGVWGTYNTTSAIPFMGRPVVFKSHTSQSSNHTRREEVRLPLLKTKQMGLLHGVIRMARNPGDQILRNSFRWLNRKCYGEGDGCFFKNAHVCCEDLANDTSTYRAFHSFWNEIQLNTSQLIVHYEHITSKQSVSKVISSVLQYLNKITPIDYIDSNQEMMKRARDIIREPKYEHGTLVSRVCGVDVARMVHESTKLYSERLGYVFNDVTGVWSLGDD